ncbi:L,D-transpeptidase family protein [Hufsiella ginkgonis]|uniref:L,D-TPase catalytic domain-containing protein n=1 Tax=Hufsiella ginkgonis TaxID=2695274 RepID=A0A7K1XUR0_9SPHI|nr:L,D-transpeptidase family protein [Hufsiella ginkgonis]MXV14724.1 hypothetical protein [Hufsiella ginkgonis]
MISFFLSAILALITPAAEKALPAACEQLVVVKTGDWNHTRGTLSGYYKVNGKWEKAFTSFSIVVGRSGLAWGNGLQPESWTKGKIKKEGDGNAPAGIFPLTRLFSYAGITSKLRSIKVDDHTFCVDDTASANYNRIVNTDTLSKNWTSAETMRLKTDGYKYGIVVAYNTETPVAGNGSCIFMHIWKDNASPTAGCTAMTERNMLRLIAFLDKTKYPLLVQLPAHTYKKYRGEYGLP